jgi:hypothetical protein
LQPHLVISQNLRRKAETQQCRQSRFTGFAALALDDRSMLKFDCGSVF